MFNSIDNQRKMENISVKNTSFINKIFNAIKKWLGYKIKPCKPKIKMKIKSGESPCIFNITGKVTCSGKPVTSGSVTLTAEISSGSVTISPNPALITNGVFSATLSAAPGTTGTAKLTATTTVNFDTISTVEYIDLNCPGGAAIPGITKFPVEQTVKVNTQINWTITAENSGTLALNNVKIQDTLPPGFIFVSSNPEPTSVSGSLIIWQTPQIPASIAPGEIITITLAAQSPPDAAGNYTNLVNMTGTDTSPASYSVDGQANIDVINYYAYVTNIGSNNVSVINVSSNTLVGSPIAVGSSPAGIAITPDSKYAYVANTGSFSVSVIDIASNTVTTTITSGIGDTPNSLAITPDGKYVYVTNFRSTFISVIEVATNTVTATIPAALYHSCIAITPDGKFAYSGIAGTTYVTVIDIATNTEVMSIGGFDSPGQIAITPDGKYSYVTNYPTANSVAVLDIAANTVIKTIPTGPSPYGVTVPPNGQYAYVGILGSNYVSVIDTSTNTVIGSPIIVGSTPHLIAFTPDGKFAYVCVHGENKVAVIDLADDSVLGTIPVGTNPFGIAIATVS